jgi:sterol desaturase/sphingolipid hydroxylase (fatty acid hydroxylase superfamily)
MIIGKLICVFKRLASHLIYPVGGIVFVLIYNQIVGAHDYPADFQDLAQIGTLMIFTMAVIIVFEFIIPYRKDWNNYTTNDLNDLLHFFFSSSLPDAAARYCFLTLLAFEEKEVGFFSKGILSSFPLWAQVVAGLVIYDLTYYWYHRAFHTNPWLWRIHRVHHSSEKLSFTKTFRFNVIEIFVENVLLLSLLAASGMDVAATGWVVSMTTYTLLLKHANIDIRIPRALDWIFVSPATHRIHHSSNLQEFNKNYSGFTMVWDRIFGTYKNGSDYSGASAGLPDHKVSRNFIGQALDFLRN